MLSPPFMLFLIISTTVGPTSGELLVVPTSQPAMTTMRLWMSTVSLFNSSTEDSFFVINMFDCNFEI